MNTITVTLSCFAAWQEAVPDVISLAWELEFLHLLAAFTKQAKLHAVGTSRPDRKIDAIGVGGGAKGERATSLYHLPLSLIGLKCQMSSL